MARVTVASVNAALKKAGFKDQLVNGGGYFYWVTESGEPWPSVYGSSTADAWSIDEWLAMAEENKRSEQGGDAPKDIEFTTYGGKYRIKFNGFLG